MARAKVGDIHNWKWKGKVCKGIWKDHLDKDGDPCLKCSECGARRYNYGLGVL